MGKKIIYFAALLMLVASCGTQKSISFLGDSYTTFEGYIPEGNAIWYFCPPDTSRTDVSTVEQTWWYKVAAEGGFKMDKNESYSGATISYTGYSGEDYSDRSFITRLPRVGTPDILVILGGTNDSWAGAQVGEYKYEDIQREDLYTYRPALARLLQDAKERFPKTKILFVMNSELREDITTSSREICQHYGIPFLQLEEIDKIAGHPSVSGMEAIASQVLSALK
ncbi:MAG: hypothetical protein IIU32_07215 [Firmicutes bacterium]|nr:hypothetical protein [Bacillota bacterium]